MGMITAVVFHLLNTGGEDFPLGIPKAHSYNFELAAMYVLVLGYFSIAGAGRFSAVSSTSTRACLTRPPAARSIDAGTTLLGCHPCRIRLPSMLRDNPRDGALHSLRAVRTQP